MRYLPIDKARPEMLLASSVYDKEERAIVRVNSKLSQCDIEKISELGYAGVFVYDNDNIARNLPILSEKQRIEAVKSLKNLSIDDCLYIANEITEEMLSLPTIAMETMKLSTKDGYTYTHSVNVCTLSVAIGIGMGMNNEELKALAQGALLHDIGKAAINPEILNKPSKLTEEEFEKMKKHVTYGYRMLRGNNAIAFSSKAAVYQHHENEDGSGYPQGLGSDCIHIFGKIIHVADVYDALTHKRCYKEAMDPADALRYLAENTGTLFNKEVVEVFMRYVAPYPVGAVVELSNSHAS